MKLRNPFTQPGNWYKANLHTHTTVSDGRASPAETAELYRRAGYHVLALTDHSRTNDVRGLSRKGFLVVNGAEYHPDCPTTANPHHLVAIHLPHGFQLSRPDDANRCIREVAAAGGVSILAHPLWCGHRYEQYAYIRGYAAVEIYNATCDKIARSSGEADYAHLLDAGRYVGAVAVDDTHRPIDRFQAWTWLRMPALSVRSVLAALRSGCTYSSTGPKVHDFRVRRRPAGPHGRGVVEVRCSPAEFIYLSAQTYHGARRMAEAGRSIRKFRCPVGADWTYVRAIVVDHRGRKAWTNPIVL